MNQYLKKFSGENRWIGILLGIFGAILLFFLIAVIFVSCGSSNDWQTTTTTTAEGEASAQFIAQTTNGNEQQDEVVENTDNYPIFAQDEVKLTESNIYSEYAALLDVSKNQIIASRNAEEKMYPASMTKLMTLLVAVENITDFNATYTLTYDMIAPLIEQGAARAGFEDGETVSVTDLLYGMILPSGADATIALALYVGDNESNFVNMMNDKAHRIGMSHTHFTNTTGLYDKEHYSTAADMAILMKEVMKNTTCSKVLSSVEYTTTSTQQHPGGIRLQSTTFSRMYGTEVSGIEIVAGKTGFHDEAMQCLATYARAVNGKEYVLITAHAMTDMEPIRDAFAIYGTITGTYEMPKDLHKQTTPAVTDAHVVVTDVYGALVTDENGKIVTEIVPAGAASKTTETETVEETQATLTTDAANNDTYSYDYNNGYDYNSYDYNYGNTAYGLYN